MESEDNECFCNNCKKYVTTANFATHSAYCERYIFVCAICEEPVQKSEKDQHLEEYHVTSPCNLCKASIEKWMLPKHMEICPKRLVTCKYCEADFQLNEYSVHVEFCGSRTEKCLSCQKYVMIKEKIQHNELHMLERQLCAKNIEDEIKQNKVNEVICSKDTAEKKSEKPSETIGSTFPKISEGKNACFSDESKKITCKEDLNLENPACEGAYVPLPQKELSKYYTQCHICKQTIPWVDFNMHVPSCASSAGKCSLCGENVPSHALKDHMKKHGNSRLNSPFFKASDNESCYENQYRNNQSNVAKSNMHDVLKCPYCSEHFVEDQVSEHLKSCPKNLYECPLCCEKIPEKDKERHEKYECRMIQNSDESNKPYLSRCSKKFFECPLCSKQVLEEDGHQHMTLQCEQLLRIGGTHGLCAAGEDLFECPYCSEKMPQKNKVMHESFLCKVLIANSEINISDSYADVTKKTNRSDYKNDQSIDTCPTCKNLFSKEKITEHKNKCHRLKEHCMFCNTLFDVSCREVHMQYCSGIDNRKYSDPKITAQDSRFTNERKGAIPKNTNIQDMMKPRSAKCKYCSTSYNVDILPNHERECIHMPVYCKFCDDKILLKDMNSHKCCKRRKGKNRKMQQQTSEGNVDGNFFTRTMNFFKSKDEKEVKSKQVSMQSAYSYESGSSGFQNNEKLYFDQTDDTLLPCEFCQQTFPASELVLHETGCNPDLVSYGKSDIPEKSDSEQESMKKNSVPVSKFQNIHAAVGINHPFFAKVDRSEHIELNGKSQDKIGELSQSCYNQNFSKHFQNSQKNENNDVEKKPLNFHSVWNVGNSSDLRTDHLKEVLADSDVDKTVEATNLVEKQKVKELDQGDAEKRPSSDNEMKTVLKFLNYEASSESDEEFVSLSDENGEEENSEMVNSSMNSRNIFQEKQGDSQLSKKISNGGKCKEVHQETPKSGIKAEKHPEEYCKHLTSLRTGVHKTTFPSEDNEYPDNHSEKKCEELGDTSRFSEKSKNQNEYIRSSKNWTDLKLNRYQSVAFSGDVSVNEMIDEEPEKLFKQNVTKFTESSNDQRNYFKQLTTESTMSLKGNAYPSQVAKNYEPKQLHEQNTPKSSYITKDVEENFSYFTHSKNGTNVSTVLSNKLEHLKLSSEKHNEESKDKYNQSNSRLFHTAEDDLEYIRNYRQHLPYFKFSFPEKVRKSSRDNVTDTTLPECRSGHNVDQAFVLEPAGSQKESKLPLHTLLKTEVKAVGLEEKIAALQRDKKILSSPTNDKNDDDTKWKKWQKKDLSNISDSD